MLKTKHGISFVVAAVSVLLLVACGDDDSDFATRPSEGSSSSVCEDCDESSSSSESVILSSDSHEGSSSSSTKSSSSEAKSSSSSVTPQSSDSETSVSSSSSAKSSSSSSAKSSSSEKSSSSTKSSSSGAKSSSSSVTPKSSDSKTSVSSSSSVTGRTSCDVNTDKNCFMDSRDGQTYKTVTIGTQTWMAENLNYAYTDVPYKSGDNTSDSTSWCYNDDANNCSKYGRLYTWAAAMDSVGTWSTNGKGCGYNKTCSPTYPVRGVCPEGWHLPTEEEFETLFTAVGGQSTAGKVLRSTSGWNSGNGSDAFAFSALPAGGRYNSGNYNNEGINTYFWSSTELDCTDAYYMDLYYGYGGAYLYNHYKLNGFSVRCLRD